MVISEDLWKLWESDLNVKAPEMVLPLKVKAAMKLKGGPLGPFPDSTLRRIDSLTMYLKSTENSSSILAYLYKLNKMSSPFAALFRFPCKVKLIDESS